MTLSASDRGHIIEGLKTIHAEISTLAARNSRPADTVQLLAVSKTKPAEAIRIAFDQGQRAFGENYLQEALEKQQILSDLPLEWHFIGPIQSNKTRDIAAHFDWVQGVDRFKIAKRLSDQRPADLPPLNICLQINLDKETSKSGISLEQLPELVSQISDLPRLTLRGLMAIPAPRDNYDEQLATFRQLADAKARYPEMDTLSMGMTNDMAAAIAAGATIVRIGTAIFGKRDVQ